MKKVWHCTVTHDFWLLGYPIEVLHSIQSASGTSLTQKSSKAIFGTWHVAVWDRVERGYESL
jgi:hypothetical protein